MSQPVSLYMIARNEAHHLPDCLAPLTSLVHEMIVVDTGSTDRTREVALELGARVVDFPWQDSFSAALNVGLDAVAGPWVFRIDADERLDEDNRQRLQDLFSRLGDENAAYLLKVHSPMPPGGGLATEVDVVRLFRKQAGVHWEYRMHDQVLPSLQRAGAELRTTDIVLHHLGYQDFKQRKSKIERNLRLLQLDHADRPNDPVPVYYLACSALDRQESVEAISFCRRALELTPPDAVLEPKVHAILTRAHHQLGQWGEALAACQAGRVRHPNNAELLFLEAWLRRNHGDLAGAETCLQWLLQLRSGPNFNGSESGLRGYRAQHELALIYDQQGRVDQAWKQWRAALAEEPGFGLASLGLGESYLKRGRWPELDDLIRALESGPQAGVEAALLRALRHLVHGELPAARQRTEEVIARVPWMLEARILLGRILLREGRDRAAAAQALREVLALDPGNVEARQHLQRLGMPGH